MIEPLESRIVLSVPVVAVDGGDSISAARALGTLPTALVVKDALTGGEFSDLYRFSVASKGNVNVTLAGMTANANLRVLDSGGREVAAAAHARTKADSVSRSLDRGDYEIAVDRASGAADTPFSLTVRADYNYENVSIDGHAYSLGIIRSDRTSAAVVPSRETWVVMHGWRNSPATVARLARAIDAAPGQSQVLVVDWSQAAAGDTYQVALRVPDVGAWVAKKLRAWGIPGANINLVGHSYGGYMADEVAMRIPGGVNRVVALETAIPGIAGTDRAIINYAAHSRYSVAFIGSAYGNVAVSKTADQMILLDVGNFATSDAHVHVRDFYTGVLERDNSGAPDRISALFSLTAIGSGAARPFLRDGQGNGYEARIAAYGSNGVYYPSTLTYKDATTKKAVTRGA